MPREIFVHVSSNGDYWQADWKDAAGRRRKKSIGPKSELSLRQARKHGQKLANELNKRPGLAEAGTPSSALANAAEHEVTEAPQAVSNLIKGMIAGFAALGALLIKAIRSLFGKGKAPAQEDLTGAGSQQL